MSGESLLGRAQSLLDSLREKGLHLPNPGRVDGDTDAVASLAAEIRAIAREPAPILVARFDAEGALLVRTGGEAALARAATIEVRAFAPWRDGPRVRRVPVRGAETVIDGVERDGPVNVALLDAAGAPLAWLTVEPA